MNKQSTFCKKLPLLAGIVFVLSARLASAQYTNQGFQYQSPSPMVAGVSTQLSIQPGMASSPVPVTVYGSYFWSQLNGASTLAYATTYANSNGYGSPAQLKYSSASNVKVAQMIQDGTGTAYYLTSEYNKQFTAEGGWVDVLVGHYLHAGTQVLSLANKPLRLVLDGFGCSAQIFVLETDTNNYGVVEGFKLPNPVPDCGAWYRFGSVSLAAGTPVEIGIAGGQVAVVGNRAMQCWIAGGLVSGLGGVLYIFPESLASAGSPDYTPCRADGNFLFLKGFARDATESVAVAANQIYLYGDILWTSGPYHLAYYFGKHSLTAAGFVDGGLYPTPVAPYSPQPTEHAGRHSFMRTTTLSSVGVSNGAVLDSASGYLYITGTATPDGYNQAAKTAQFQVGGGLRLVFSHPYPNSAGIALDSSGYIYAGAGGQIGTGTWALAFQSYDANGNSKGSGQWTRSSQMVPTAFLLRRYLTGRPDVFLGGSIMSPDSQHMYTGVATQFSVP